MCVCAHVCVCVCVFRVQLGPRVAHIKHIKGRISSEHSLKSHTKEYELYLVRNEIKH